jgi:putative nucleotidyltransferase with HDIG domain
MIDVIKLKNICYSLRVLYVEDDEELHKAVLTYLKKLFKDVDAAYNGQDGLIKYKSNEYDLVLADIKMPKLDGLKMTKAIKKIKPDQEVVILSAHTEQDYFLKAIHLGVSDYILKPIDHKQMNTVLYKVANRVCIFKENLEYHQNLEKLVAEKTKSLTDNYEQTLTAMVQMIENRDSYTGGHSKRVANYCKAIAQEMKLSEQECNLVFRAGMLHDIGKVTTPDSILLKPKKLSNREFLIIQSHVTASYQLLSKIPMYSEIAEIILSHHEHCDGSGYPNGLKSNEISILSHIMIIADAFDAMTTSRIYKGRQTVEDAVKEIKSLSGIQFYSVVVPYACKSLSKITIGDHSQLPKNMIEQERFSYFYRDNMTDTFNYTYLNIFIRECHDLTKYSSVIYFMENLSHYNNKFGWMAGDKILKMFANYLRDNYPDALIFRIHGDDFIIIYEEPISDSLESNTQPSFLFDTDITISSNKFNSLNDIIENIEFLKGS